MPPKFYKKKSYAKSAPKTDRVNTSATFLVIVESPSKCSKIESFLGSDYCCIASKGHIRTIEGLKSIDTKSTFEPTFSIIDEKKGHVEFMRSVINHFSNSNIILASDDDREGEAIAWHICKVFDLPIETTKRIIFHEVTKNAIIEAVKSPTIVNMNLVHAQHARQVLDMIVGYKISPFLWKYLFHDKNNSLSAGRCQTPALRLIYDNEKEKRDKEMKYKTVGQFFSKNIAFDLNHEFENTEEAETFMNKSIGFSYSLSTGSQKEVKRSPPRPFNTSKLLQTASNTLHISPKETMSLCQQLYQDGHITYMRTESTKYAPVYLEQAKKHIISEYKKLEYLGNLEAIANKDANNPHEAIRVTHLETKFIKSDNSRLSTMYKLIWRNSVESCMSDAVYKCTPIKITAPMDKTYGYTVEIPIFLGWKKVNEKSQDSGDVGTEHQNDPGALLFYFQSLEQSKKPFTHNAVTSSFTVRNKHQHYTEASLITKLEDLGIGRPSTFATIVDTIQDRGYVKRMDLEGEKTKSKDFKLTGNVLEITEREKVFGNEKNKLVLQNTGLMTIEFLTQHFQELFDYHYTKAMEDKLDFVSDGREADWAAICKQCYNEIKELSKPIAKLEKQVFPLDGDKEFVFERYGPVVRRKLEDGTFEYKPVKKDLKIDLEKLRAGGYTADELYEIKNNNLGQYEGFDLFIKNGKFGPYVEWGEKRESIKNLKKPLDQITREDVVEYLGSDVKSKGINVLRILNPDLSIRKGRFGPYAFYKTPDMSKPEFYSIKKFPEGFLACDEKTLIDWIHDNHINK